MSVLLQDHPNHIEPVFWQVAGGFAQDAYDVRHALADVTLVRAARENPGLSELDRHAGAVLAEFHSPALRQERKAALLGQLSAAESVQAERLRQLKDEIRSFFSGNRCLNPTRWTYQTIERLGFAAYDAELPGPGTGDGVLRYGLELAERFRLIAGVIEKHQFDALLGRLHPEVETAGEAYEKLRDRLLHFFEARQWQTTETGRFFDVGRAADETLTRTAEKIYEEIECDVAPATRIQNVNAYTLGVARLVWLELQNQVNPVPPPPMPPSPSPNRLRRTQAECLQTLTPEQRRLLIRYCGCTVLDEQHAARYRRQLVEEFDFKDLKALHQHVSYLRQKLERCVERRMQLTNPSNSPSAGPEPEDFFNDTFKF